MQRSSQISANDIDKRRKELLELSSYIQTIDNDVTMILQSLQWDRKHLIEATPSTLCRYDRNHRVPPDKLKDHEKECYVRRLGYSKEDLLLPEPLDANANTLVTLNKNHIENIIDYAVNVDPSFIKGRGGEPVPPLSLERLQQAYSANERRALHDAVVSAAPSCHDLNELALLGGDADAHSSKRKSRAEILAELRDMKRRRTKYRGAAKTENYSDVLRGVIATQMEHYSEALNVNTKNYSQNMNKSNAETPKDYREIYIKKEPCEQDKTNAHKYTDKDTRRISSKEYERHRDKSREELRHRQNYKDETRHVDRSKDKYNEREKIYDYSKRDKDDRRHKDDRNKHSSSSKERRRDKDYRDSDGYGDDSRGNHRRGDKHTDSRRKDHKDYKSRNSETKYKHEYDSQNSHREVKHKRYYDYKQDKYEVPKKIIKQERD